ncbi:MAG: toll/interleukin-1 receptor domain-containing protein, partial [Verrucomicrobia bacterium]|nr:toll/interleukin-1 receptor domain-containing protein [Verrucomicrobiota bacterium]
MENDVFISHAYQDKSVADAICQRLESAGLKCWTVGRDATSAEENWTFTRNAIASSQLIVLVLSEHANAAPHIKRELAHAFYTRRIIVPLRLAGAFPRRDFLFYLSSVPSFNAAGAPEEQLDSLTTHIKSLVLPRAVAGRTFSPQRTKDKTGKLNLSKSSLSALQASHHRTLRLLKWGSIGTALFAVIWFLWFTFWQP